MRQLPSYDQVRTLRLSMRDRDTRGHNLKRSDVVCSFFLRETFLNNSCFSASFFLALGINQKIKVMSEMLNTPMAIFQSLGSLVILSVGAFYCIKALKQDIQMVEEITTKKGKKVLRDFETGKFVKRK